MSILGKILHKAAEVLVVALLDVISNRHSRLQRLLERLLL